MAYNSRAGEMVVTGAAVVIGGVTLVLGAAVVAGTVRLVSGAAVVARGVVRGAAVVA